MFVVVGGEEEHLDVRRGLTVRKVHSRAKCRFTRM